MLTVAGLSVHYGEARALNEVHLSIEEGEVVTILGANGAGKTTLLRTISGLVRPTTGMIEFEGRDIAGLDTERIASMGIAHVPERRRVFPGLSVMDNLMLGTCSRPKELRGSDEIRADLERVFSLFPKLRQLRNQVGWTLSGGEQQMLTMGRGLMARPRLLLLDEPSLGLAPILVNDVFGAIRGIHESGTSVLLVEQNARKALQIADRGYCLTLGSVVAEGTAAQLLGDEALTRAYIGAR